MSLVDTTGRDRILSAMRRGQRQPISGGIAHQVASLDRVCSVLGDHLLFKVAVTTTGRKAAQAAAGCTKWVGWVGYPLVLRCVTSPAARECGPSAVSTTSRPSESRSVAVPSRKTPPGNSTRTCRPKVADSSR